MSSFRTAADYRIPPERRIQRRTEALLAYFRRHPDEIDTRISELDREWTIERVVETEAAGTILAGSALALGVDRKWLALPAFAAAMLLLHNTQGFYPLLPLLRRMGVRTAKEIADERNTLRAMRGDVSPALAPQRRDSAFDTDTSAPAPQEG
jgi:hypothetical protein